jgi:hypothetical protein
MRTMRVCVMLITYVHAHTSTDTCAVAGVNPQYSRAHTQSARCCMLWTVAFILCDDQSTGLHDWQHRGSTSDEPAVRAAVHNYYLQCDAAAAQPAVAWARCHGSAGQREPRLLLHIKNCIQRTVFFLQGLFFLHEQNDLQRTVSGSLFHIRKMLL